MTPTDQTMSAGEALIAKFTDWARQVAAREDVPRGIRSAAACLADEGRRHAALPAAAPAAQPVEPWPIRGARVDGDTVVISVKGGNDAARRLCGELVALIEAGKGDAS